MEISQTAGKLQENGVRLERPRWFNFVIESYTPASPEEVERRLADGKALRAVIPGVEVPLPVNSPQDVQELAHFQTGEPEHLSRPDVAENLTRLHEEGWRFADRQGRAVGLYGAYNAVTDAAFELEVLARKGEREIPLDTAERANGLAAFYVLQPNEEARCEEAGYRFFNTNGSSQPVFLLPEGGRVGRQEPWVSRGENVRERLRQFEELEARLDGDLELARAVSDEPRLDLGAARRLLQGRSQEQRDRLAPLLVEPLRAQPDFKSLIQPGDRAMMLEWLKEDPRQALVAAATSDSERMRLFSARQPIDLAGETLSQPASRELLALLSQSSTSAAGFSRWGGEPGVALGVIRDKPDLQGVDLCRLAAEGIPWADHDAHLRHLAEFAQLPQTRELARVCQQVIARVETPETRWAVWKAFAIEPEGKDVRAYGQRIFEQLSKLTHKDRPDAAQLAESLLAELPPTALDGVGDHLPAEKLRYLLEHGPPQGPAELGRMASECLPYTDQAGHRDVLQMQGTFKTGVAERLHDAVDDPISRWAVWKAGALEPDGDGVAAINDLTEKARALMQGQTYDARAADLKKLTRAANLELARLGQGKAALEAQERWGVADKDCAVEALSTHASDLGELAANSIPYGDAEAQSKALLELGSPAARRLFDSVEQPEMRWAVFKAAVLHPKADARELGRQAYANLESIKSVPIENKAAELESLARALLAELETEPDGRALAGWKLKELDMAVRALVESRSGSIGELAAASIPWTDEATHRVVLADFAADPGTSAASGRALRVHDQVQGQHFRWAVWKAYVLNPDAGAGELARDTLEQLDSIKNVAIPDKGAEYARLYEALRDELSTTGSQAMARWGVEGGELALRGLLENPCPDNPTGLGQLAAATIPWGDEVTHRLVLDELIAGRDTRFLAQTTLRLHDAVKSPVTRWAIWKACVVEPENPDLGAFRRRLSELIDSVSSYDGRSEDVKLLFTQLLAEEEVRRLMEGLKASSDGISVEENRVVVGGVVLRNRRGADPPGEA